MYLRASVFVKGPKKSRNRKIWSMQRFIHIRHHTFYYQITRYLHPKRFVSLPLIFLRWANISALCSQFFSVRVPTSANSLSSSTLLKLLDYVFIPSIEHPRHLLLLLWNLLTTQLQNLFVTHFNITLIYILPLRRKLHVILTKFYQPYFRVATVTKFGEEVHLLERNR